MRRQCVQEFCKLDVQYIIYLLKVIVGDFPGGQDPTLSMQGARVQSLVRELDAACRN